MFPGYNFFMTRQDFFDYTNAHKEFEFSFKEKTYNMTYGKEDDGREYIKFGLLYEEKKYQSASELLAHAKIDQYHFRDILEELL